MDTFTFFLILIGEVLFLAFVWWIDHRGQS